MWSIVAPVLPRLALVLAVLIIGLWVAGFISDNLEKIIKKTKAGDLLDKIIFSHITKLTGSKINTSSIVGTAIKWFLVAVVLLSALDLAHLSKVINFFNYAVGYFPNILFAVLIVLAGTLLANLAASLIRFVTKKDNLTAIAKVTINILAFISALSQLVPPIIASLSQLIGQLNLSHLQADVLFIGVLVLVLLASKNTVTKAVENLYKI